MSQPSSQSAPPASAVPEVLLRLRGISKEFFGTPVVKNVDLDLHRGEVHALMGENGAGKSTLMKVLAGIHRPDAGEIYLEGRRLDAPGPGQMLRYGVSFIHQELQLVPELTAAENIFLGAEITRSGICLGRRAMQAEADRLLADLEAGFSSEVRVADLPLASQQLVEIARALQHRSRLVIMDEPTAALSERESQRLFSLIGRLRAQHVAVVYISHRMPEVEMLADRVTVLRDGERVATLTRGEFTPEQLVALMVGRALHAYQRPEPRPVAGRVVLRAAGLGDRRRVRSVDLEIRAGEVVGLTGLVGAGRTETARLLFGAEKPATGSIEFEGKRVEWSSPLQAMQAGVAYVPEERKTQGLFLDLGSDTNLSLILAGLTARHGLRDHRCLQRYAEDTAARLSVRAGSLARPVRLLSGGNQQKVLLGRWLALAPKLLILDEPTRGVDVGAKSEIYQLIDGLAREGRAVLVISSELPEVIALSDRVVVMRDGRIAGSLDGTSGPITQEAIMGLASGIQSAAA